MQRKYGWLAGLTLAALATTATAGTADSESGFYFGGAFGQSSYDIKKSDADGVFIDALDVVGIDVLDGDSDLDKSDTLFGALVGYKFNSYFAVEAAYIDLGKADYDATAEVFIPGEGFDTLEGSLSLESSGPALSGIGVLPISDSFDLYARLGIFFSDTKLKIGLASATESASESLSGKDEDVFYGIGANWNIGPSWTLRFEYQLFEKVGKKSETGEGDVDALTLGVLYRL